MEPRWGHRPLGLVPGLQNCLSSYTKILRETIFTVPTQSVMQTAANLSRTVKHPCFQKSGTTQWAMTGLSYLSGALGKSYDVSEPQISPCEQRSAASLAVGRIKQGHCAPEGLSDGLAFVPGPA